MVKKRTKKLFTALASTVLAGTVLGTGVASVAFADSVISADGKYYSDYSTYEEALAAAKEIGYEVAAEGTVLLKNKDDALPLNANARVSIFGVSQDAPSGNNSGDVLLDEALQKDGFRVNPQLNSYYKSIGTTFGEETTDFSKSIETSMGLYNDAAIVMISRAGGEGLYADNATVTEEESNDAEENVGGWEHAALHHEEDKTTTYKHFMQFTDSEVELLNYVKAQGFKKIIYLINSSVPMEVYNIENDDAVDSILWIGRPGAIGFQAVADIIAGEVNPSGRTADTWYTDFTADPTWYNFGDNMQSNTTYYDDSVGDTSAGNWDLSMFFTYSNSYKDGDGKATNYSGIDYEEDIYTGYRYYETKAADMNKAKEGSGETWYQQAVTYPFGYGLSYTSFEFSDLKVKLSNGTVVDGNTIDADMFSSSVGKEAAVKTATATITVTNTGSVAGKETVQVYVQAPYITGEVEKAHEVLVGYAKTDLLRPGKSQTVQIEFNIQDFASYDYTDANENGNKGYELDAGEYTIHVTNNSHGWANTDSKEYESVDFTLDDDAILKQDDFSGNVIENLFSSENGMFYSLRDNSEASKYNFNASTTAGEVLMTRADGFGDSFPESPTTADMTISADMLKSLEYWDNFVVDNEGYEDGKVIAGIVDKDDYPWLLTDAQKEQMKTWTQTGTYGYKMSDMTGLDYNDTTTILTAQDTSVADFVGKTPAQAWELFMNTLSWYDCQQLVANWQQKTLDAIDMHAVIGSDSGYNYSNTFAFPDNCVLASTWNAELAEREGRAIGNIALLKGNNTWWAAPYRFTVRISQAVFPNICRKIVSLRALPVPIRSAARSPRVSFATSSTAYSTTRRPTAQAITWRRGFPSRLFVSSISNPSRCARRKARLSRLWAPMRVSAESISILTITLLPSCCAVSSGLIR